MSYVSILFSITVMVNHVVISIGVVPLEIRSRSLCLSCQLMPFSQSVSLIFLSWMKKKRKICLVIRNNCIECLKELLHMLLMMAYWDSQLCVSKWNTLWSRILRLYVAKSRPSYELKWIIITIIMSSAPMCFYVKMNRNLTYGARNVFRSLLCKKSLNSNKNTIEKKNAYFSQRSTSSWDVCRWGRDY